MPTEIDDVIYYSDEEIDEIIAKQAEKLVEKFEADEKDHYNIEIVVDGKTMYADDRA